MHIVHILTRMLRAGSEENILLTSAGQIAAGDEVTLIYGADSTPALAQKLAPKARLIEIPPMVRPIHPLKDIAAYRQIRSTLQNLRPDVVHTHQSKAGILGRFAAQSAAVRCIVHGVHILPYIGTSGLKRKLYLAAERAADRITDGYIHVSNGMFNGCRDHGIGQQVPHKVVHSGFDLARFRDAPPADDAAEILGAHCSDPPPMVLLMMAALEGRKRHLELMTALAPLIRQQPRIRLLFAGEGPLAAPIRHRAEQLGIAGSVRLLGYRPDVERIIALSDICLLSSGQEGLPRSVLQYLVSAKPVVLFDLPGLGEVITPNRNALVIQPDDWAGFGKAVQELVGNPQRRQNLSDQAARTDLSNWDWTVMGRQTTAFYRSLQKEAQP
ncbi:glycosyltransferase [Aliiroseovarius crassostreae]|uniref:glycosyltransferase n=1 Tax=Aliiroseovarius crassostreae TaxID=154981 RepID=UPI003C7DED31